MYLMCALRPVSSLQHHIHRYPPQVTYMEIDRNDRQDKSGNPSGTHTPSNEGRCWVRQMGLSQSLTSDRWVHQQFAFNMA